MNSSILGGLAVMWLGGAILLSRTGNPFLVSAAFGIAAWFLIGLGFMSYARAKGYHGALGFVPAILPVLSVWAILLFLIMWVVLVILPDQFKSVIPANLAKQNPLRTMKRARKSEARGDLEQALVQYGETAQQGRALTDAMTNALQPGTASVNELMRRLLRQEIDVLKRMVGEAETQSEFVKKRLQEEQKGSPVAAAA